jgi:hypothetical protein
MKPKLYLRRFRSANGFGLILFRPDWPNSGPYFVLLLRPRQHRVLLRVLRHVVGLSWWSPRFWNSAALLTERRTRTAT